MFYDRDWRGVTIEEFMERIGKHIERCNAKRVKRSLGGMSPMDYRRSLGLAAQGSRYGKSVPSPFLSIIA